MKKLFIVLVAVAPWSMSSCDHFNPRVSESSGNSTTGGGALPAGSSDSVRGLPQPKTPALNNDTNKTFKIDSIKKNP